MPALFSFWLRGLPNKWRACAPDSCQSEGCVTGGGGENGQDDCSIFTREKDMKIFFHALAALGIISTAAAAFD